MSKRTIVLGGIVLLAVASALGAGKKEPEARSPGTGPAVVATVRPQQTADVPVALKQAIDSAQAYLRTASFSAKGLVSQLEYEGFSNADARKAVESITVDWNEQAAKSAAAYLRTSSFSRSGLVDQLKYEGFTASQAEYGVSVAYR